MDGAAPEGFAILPDAVPVADIEALLAVLSTLPPGTEPRRRGGTRDLFESVPQVRELARSGAMRAAAEAVLGPDCFAVRALLFDKTPEANWKDIWRAPLRRGLWPLVREGGHCPRAAAHRAPGADGGGAPAPR